MEGLIFGILQYFQTFSVIFFGTFSIAVFFWEWSLTEKR